MDPTTAKEFLVSRITEEAAMEGVELTEVEKKMMYYSERHPSLSDIAEVTTEFDQKYDMFEYEAKIAALARNAFRQDRKGSSERMQQWKAARKALRWEDHYIKVMLTQAFRHEHKTRDFLIYVGSGVAVVVIIVLYIVLFGHR